MKSTITDWDSLPLFLTVPDLMLVLGYAKKKVYDLCHSKDFPAIVDKRNIRVSKYALKEWSESFSGKKK
jgi:predicted DNA-binding transcriptional regulator AlpA